MNIKMIAMIIVLTQPSNAQPNKVPMMFKTIPPIFAQTPKQQTKSMRHIIDNMIYIYKITYCYIYIIVIKWALSKII